MTMVVAQVRVPEGLLDEIDVLVDKGFYSNRSDVIRDAVRRLIIERQIGSVTNTGDSVKEVREIRKKLSKERADLKKLNGY